MQTDVFRIAITLLQKLLIQHAVTCVQALVVCSLPGLFENLIKPPSSGPGLQAYISLYNSIWLFVFACVAYGVVSCKDVF